jgi:hypothetical protein
MRIVLLSTAAIALSGCSWLGMGGHHGNSYGHHNAGYGAYKAQPMKKAHHHGNTLSRWNVEGGYGQEFITGGNVIQTAPNGLNLTAPTKTTMKSGYEVGERFDLGVSYALDPNRKVILNGYQSKFDGERQIIGTQGATTLSGQISDYDAIGIEAGIRQYALPVRAPIVKSIRPYLEARAGVAKVDDINVSAVTRTSPGGVVTNRAGYGLYDGGWVPTAAGLVGVETPLFNRMTIGLESGLRYSGKLDAVDGGFAGADGASKWSVPVSLRGRYRF